MTQLPLLQRREVEAQVIAPIIRELGDRFGRQEVLEVLSETIKRLARESGDQLAAQLGSNELADLARVLHVWRQDGSLEINMLREDDQHFDFDVTRCKYAEMYHRLGIPELGPVLSCNRDFCFAEGFNRNLTLTRTQTIMEGASHCNFRFSMTPSTPSTMPIEEDGDDVSRS